MTNEVFKNHRSKNPHLSFRLIMSKIIPIEYSYSDEYGIYNIVKRDFYEKSNKKTCYVDNFIKQVKVERHKLKASSNGYAFVIRNRFIRQYI